ncbi:class I SAM-dependent methyltransferase [Streptomyces europaeiscabiei]|uniref:class I SAM-dependent methyltransferase n=1 Tax=Streptomyces europaeiscabiei TaxID=146819 RepID=UPI00399A0965
MKSLLHRLSPDQWDAWYSQGRAIDRLVTDAEVDRFLQHVNPHAGASVLDVGCGIGSFSRQLSRWGYDVLGLDFSPIAIRTAHRQGVNGRLHYGVHDFDAGAIPGPRRLPGSPRPGPVDHAGGPRKQMNTAPVDHGVLYAARSTKVPCSFLHHPLPSFPSLRRPAWRPSARMPRETKSAAWLPSSSRSPILAGRAGCATGSPRCWPWWSVR